jgi:peroxin-6
MLKAITRQARAVDKKVKEYNDTHDQKITIAYFFDHLATEEDTAVLVTEEDYIEAHKELVPSVSADELRHYDRVRRTFEGAGKPDDKKQPPATNGSTAAAPSASGKGKDKGKGKANAVAPADGEDIVVGTDSMDLNGAGGSASAKGKGKASASAHASKSSVDIAEGGFGNAGDDDELYS